jgi:hypothetical protein
MEEDDYDDENLKKGNLTDLVSCFNNIGLRINICGDSSIFPVAPSKDKQKADEVRPQFLFHFAFYLVCSPESHILVCNSL